jgi:hypothetical protein
LFPAVYATKVNTPYQTRDLSLPDLVFPTTCGARFTENNEVAVSKRAVNDYLNEGVNSLFNPSDSSVISKRGMAVYNQPNNIFITDQFKAVLHGDYGLDGLDTVALNPGDLLTFGGGINAGKLVKVNVNSFGPDILVVGIVEKYIASTNLLHFRQVNYSLSFGTNNLTLLYDFGNPVSYSSGTTVYDLSPNGKNGLIQNGPIYTNAGASSYFTFDKTNDVIETNTSGAGFGINNQSFTLVTVCRPDNTNGDNMVFLISINVIKKCCQGCRFAISRRSNN